MLDHCVRPLPVGVEEDMGLEVTLRRGIAGDPPIHGATGVLGVRWRTICREPRRPPVVVFLYVPLHLSSPYRQNPTLHLMAYGWILLLLGVQVKPFAGTRLASLWLTGRVDALRRCFARQYTARPCTAFLSCRGRRIRPSPCPWRPCRCTGRSDSAECRADPQARLTPGETPALGSTLGGWRRGGGRCRPSSRPPRGGV